MNVPLSPKELEVVSQMADELELPPEKIMIHALRIYQMVLARQKLNQHMAWADIDGNLIKEPVGGCMGD